MELMDLEQLQSDLKNCEARVEEFIEELKLNCAKVNVIHDFLIRQFGVEIIRNSVKRSHLSGAVESIANSIRSQRRISSSNQKPARQQPEEEEELEPVVRVKCEIFENPNENDAEPDWPGGEQFMEDFTGCGEEDDEIGLTEASRHSSGPRQTKKKSSIWAFFTTIRMGRKIVKNICNACRCHVSPKVERLREHLDHKCVGRPERNLLPRKFEHKSRKGSAERPRFTEYDMDTDDLPLDMDYIPDENDDFSKKPSVVSHHKRSSLGNSDENSPSGGYNNSAIWAQFIVTRNEFNKIISNICKSCNNHVSPKIERLRIHIQSKCPNPSEEARKALTLPAQKGRPKKVETDGDIKDDVKRPLAAPRSKEVGAGADEDQSEEEPAGTPDSRVEEMYIYEETEENRNYRCKVWKFFDIEEIDETKYTGKRNKIKSCICKKCGYNVSPKIERLRTHILYNCTANKSRLKKPKVRKAKYKRAPDIWSKFITTEITEKKYGRKRYSNAVCRVCGIAVSPRVYRLRQHLQYKCRGFWGEPTKTGDRVTSETANKPEKIKNKMSAADRKEANLRTPRMRVGQQCEECGKILFGSLAQHMLTHTGMRNYNCSLCGKSFLRSKDVRRHKLSVHEGIKQKRKGKSKHKDAEEPGPSSEGPVLPAAPGPGPGGNHLIEPSTHLAHNPTFPIQIKEQIPDNSFV